MSTRRAFPGLRRSAKSVATTLRVPPRWTTYRHLPASPIADYARRTPGGVETTLMAAGPSGAPMPMNVGDVADLPTERGNWGVSFSDIPTQVHGPVVLLRVPDCHVLSVRAQWDLEHYALVAGGSVRLQAPGMRWFPPHRRALARRGPVPTLDRISWPWEAWPANYLHWMVRHVPKLALLQAHGLADDIMLPPALPVSEVMRDSAAALGIDLARLPRLTAKHVHARDLHTIHAPNLHPSVVDLLRKSYGSMLRPSEGRLIFVSRADVKWRRLLNEDATRELVEQRGFEVVDFSKMSFAEQVAVGSEATTILGVHGAGLTNMIFCAPASTVIEIIDPSSPNPTYYDLAGACGHKYWLCTGEPADPSAEPGYGDLSVDLVALAELLDQALG